MMLPTISEAILGFKMLVSDTPRTDWTNFEFQYGTETCFEYEDRLKVCAKHSEAAAAKLARFRKSDAYELMQKAKNRAL